MSSSSTSANEIILDNIGLFRQYSLDQSLVESYFNQGVFFKEVDLDSTNSIGISSSSSSSSSSFLLAITLERRSYAEEEIPLDLEIYVYEETVGGAPVSGLVDVARVGNRALEVTLSSGFEPDGETDFSFRLNIEHQSLTTSRIKYVFRQGKRYETKTMISRPVSGTRGRLSSVYVEYLMGWISDFWYAWDSGDMSIVPPLANPFPDSFAPFYPFAHAWWKLQGDLGQVSALVAPPFSGGNDGLVENQNFLGVPPNIWNCIGQGLYKFDGYSENWVNDIGPPLFPRCPPQGSCAYKEPDVSFDCRSFAVLGAKFLQTQLSQLCPNATAKVMGIGTHFLVYVDLAGGGEATTCCSGQFLYEPMDASVYKDIQDFCDDEPGFCENFERPSTLFEPGQENADNDFGDPNWEDDAAELQRIEGVICGCLTGDYKAGTNEANLKSVCQQGKMQDWVAENLSFTPQQKDAEGNVTTPGSSPNLSVPQTLACRFCVLTFEANYECPTREEAGGELSQGSWQGGIFPETKCLTEEEAGKLQFDEWLPVDAGKFGSECSMQRHMKMEKVACGQSVDCASASLEATAPDLPKEAPVGCCGAWCVLDGDGKKTGQCYDGPKHSWELEDDAKRAGPFNAEKNCEQIDCCPPGFRREKSTAPFVSLADYVCVPDCKDHGCNEGCCQKDIFGHGGNCLPCSECCEPDLINYGYQICQACTDKVRSLWMDS